MIHQKAKSERSRCGFCGKTKGLTKTECCKNWICDDEHKYVAFSYARNSCHRNHSRYTLCGFHHKEGHEGSWKNCSECRDSFKTEMHVWYGTNEYILRDVKNCESRSNTQHTTGVTIYGRVGYNFEKFFNPPTYEPTKCSTCRKVIRLGIEGYSNLRGQYWCESCSKLEEKEILSDFKKFKKKAGLPQRPQSIKLKPLSLDPIVDIKFCP